MNKKERLICASVELVLKRADKEKTSKVAKELQQLYFETLKKASTRKPGKRKLQRMVQND